MTFHKPTFLKAALLAAMTCSSAGVWADDGLVVYNAQHEGLTKVWVEGFTKETGIKVTLRNGDDTEMANQIVQEGKASPADVFLTENSPSMVLVDGAGLFAPIAPTTLSQVASAYRPAHGNWVGIAARSTVFVYNKDKLTQDQLPKSILDLADPSWKGRWAASPAGADFQAIVGGMLALKGEATTLQWLKGMKANFTAYRGNSAVLKAVNAGQIDSGVIFTITASSISPRPAKTARTPPCTTSSTKTRARSSAFPVVVCWRPASIRSRRKRSSNGSPAKKVRRCSRTANPLNTPSARARPPTPS